MQGTEPRQFSVNVPEAIKRLLKYLAEGVIVALALYTLPQNSDIHITDLITISLVAMASFSVLDVLSPTMAGYARMGAGASIGSQMVGGIPSNQKHRGWWTR